MKRWSVDGYGPGAHTPPFLSRPISPPLSPAEAEAVPFPSSWTSIAPDRTRPKPRTQITLLDPPLPPRVLQLGECIGRGQFGSVYRALNLSSGRTVAVKRIALQGKTEAEVGQLENEVRLLKSLDHPSVVRYEGVVRTVDHLNIILEFIENGSLHSTLKLFGELPEELVAGYAVKILDGLDYLHSRKVVHCDLKACNLLSTKNGNIKLSDFGVSLNLAAAESISDVSGTPNWMAPEVIELKGASTASDIWSLGATLIELTTGKPPYAEYNAMSALYKIVQDECPPMPAKASEHLKDFLRLCFKKEPSHRPTARQLMSHRWLSSQWLRARGDLQPMDSIPFLRRISLQSPRPDLPDFSPSQPGSAGEERAKAEAVLTGGVGIGLGVPPVRDRLMSDFNRRVSFEMAPPTPKQIRPQPQPFQVPRYSQSHSSLELLSSLSLQPRDHSYVKTTFSRPVDCKICAEPTKRHSVLCANCGLVAHQRCADALESGCEGRPVGWTTTSENNLVFSPPNSSLPSPTFPQESGPSSFNPFTRWKRMSGTGSSGGTPLAKRSLSPAGASRLSLSSLGGSCADLPSNMGRANSSSSALSRSSSNLPETRTKSASDGPETTARRPSFGGKRVSLDLSRTASRGDSTTGGAKGVAARVKRRMSFGRTHSLPPLYSPPDKKQSADCKMQ